jgi:succinate dehydrogenase/fumarate reductase flavoprotein subunit
MKPRVGVFDSLRMLRKEYDLIVLGAGPTGVTAALAASAAGR